MRASLTSTGLFEVEVTTAPEEKSPSGLREPPGGDAGFAAAKSRHETFVRTVRVNTRPSLGHPKWNYTILPPQNGNATKTGSSDVLLLDSTRQITGPATLLTDFGLSYGGRIKTFFDLRYRVQLNVRILFNECETHPPVSSPVRGEYRAFAGPWSFMEVILE